MTDRLPLTARALRWALSHPEPLLRLLGERQPVWRDGRRLHPAMQLMLAVGARTGDTGVERDAAKARARMRTLSRISSPLRRGVHVADRRIPGPAGDIPVRVYRPWSATGGGPGIVYLHGGGFTTGDLDTHDPTCRLLADASGCVVVAVDYRLAPEHPFPAAVDDAVAAYAWVADHGEALGIAGAPGVMGDSAGATLTAVVCQEARRLGLPRPAAQCLVYPLADSHFATPSYRTFAEGFGLSMEGMDWYRSRYTPDERDWDDPRASPILADDLSGLPPALVVTAGFDPLRDDGAAYAEALAAAGVPTTYRCYDDFIHAFHGMLVVPDAAAAAEAVDAEFGALVRAELERAGSDRASGPSASGPAASGPAASGPAASGPAASERATSRPTAMVEVDR